MPTVDRTQIALPLTVLVYICNLMQNTDDKLKKVIAHAKEYGFVFPSSEIYDGLSATYDYGQYGS